MDYDGCDVRAAELLVDGAALLFLAADAQAGLRLQKFDQTAEQQQQTLRGRRLLDLCAPPPYPPPALLSAPHAQWCTLVCVKHSTAGRLPRQGALSQHH